MMEKNRVLINSVFRVEVIVRNLIFMCAFLVVAYCIWTLDRGFEITDEAYYLLLAIYADSFKFYISAQQWITAGLWQISGSITMFRATGMVLLLASSALLAHGVFSVSLRFGLVAEDRFELKSVVLAGSVVGAMLYASTINLSPCYNLLASSGAYSAAGIVLLASNRMSIVHKHVLYALAGCALGVEFLSKASAGTATLALLIFWVAIFENSRFGKIFGTMAIVFGAVTFAGIALLINTTISDATQAVEQGMQLFRIVQVETIGSRLLRYSSDFFGYFLATLKAFAIPIVAMIVYVVTHRTIFAKFGLVILVITLLLGNYLFGGWNADGSFASPPVPVFAMLLMALIVSIPVWNKNRGTFVLFVGLILLPYSVAFGTGNTLFTQVIDSLAPWGTLIAVLVITGYPNDFNKMITSLIGLCFIVTIALQIVTSSLQPYHMSSPLTKQNYAFAVGNLGEVKVDAETHKFLADIKMAAKKCEIAPGAPFIGLYNVPGVALALQAIPVLTPWLNNREQAEFVMERVHPEELHSTVVALQIGGNRVYPPLPQQLLAFPFGYRYCGMATYPYMQQRIEIWQSQAPR